MWATTHGSNRFLEWRAQETRSKLVIGRVCWTVDFTSINICKNIDKKHPQWRWYDVTFSEFSSPFGLHRAVAPGALLLLLRRWRFLEKYVLSHTNVLRVHESFLKVEGLQWTSPQSWIDWKIVRRKFTLSIIAGKSYRNFLLERSKQSSVEGKDLIDYFLIEKLKFPSIYDFPGSITQRCKLRFDLCDPFGASGNPSSPPLNTVECGRTSSFIILRAKWFTTRPVVSNDVQLLVVHASKARSFWRIPTYDFDGFDRLAVVHSRSESLSFSHVCQRD